MTQEHKQRETALVDEAQVDQSTESDGKGGVLTCTSLTAYFHEALDQARANQGLETTDAAAYYVVNLLDSFAQADRLYALGPEGRREDEALALMLARALESQPTERAEHYRRLGDVALFVSGFFADSLRRRPVGVAYYVDMGQGAYASASGLMRRGSGARALRAMFSELADSFQGWVEVLREVSEAVRLSDPPEQQGLGELFERWHSARGERARALSTALLKRGAMPMWSMS